MYCLSFYLIWTKRYRPFGVASGGAGGSRGRAVAGEPEPAPEPADVAESVSV